MKIKNVLLLMFFLTVKSIFAQSYIPVDNASSVKFAIKNFGFTVNGSLSGLKGKVLFNPASLEATFFNVTVDVNTIKTGNETRDAHLKKEDYFDAAKFPVISFVSTKVANSTMAGSYYVEGKITIKGITRAVSFPFMALPSAGGYKFEGMFKLNRRDFKVGGSSAVLSDNLTITLSVVTRNN